MKRIMVLALLLAGLFLSPEAWSQEAPFRPRTSVLFPHDSTNSQTTTDAISANIQHARLVCSAACYVAFGVSPGLLAMNTQSVYLPANVPEVFVVSPGSHIAVIGVSGAGNLSITELSK